MANTAFFNLTYDLTFNTVRKVYSRQGRQEIREAFSKLLIDEINFDAIASKITIEHLAAWQYIKDHTNDSEIQQKINEVLELASEALIKNRIEHDAELRQWVYFKLDIGMTTGELIQQQKKHNTLLQENFLADSHLPATICIPGRFSLQENNNGGYDSNFLKDARTQVEGLITIYKAKLAGNTLYKIAAHFISIVESVSYGLSATLNRVLSWLPLDSIFRNSNEQLVTSQQCKSLPSQGDLDQKTISKKFSTTISSQRKKSPLIALMGKVGFTAFNNSNSYVTEMPAKIDLSSLGEIQAEINKLTKQITDLEARNKQYMERCLPKNSQLCAQGKIVLAKNSYPSDELTIEGRFVWGRIQQDHLLAKELLNGYEALKTALHTNEQIANKPNSRSLFKNPFFKSPPQSDAISRQSKIQQLQENVEQLRQSFIENINENNQIKSNIATLS
ncbi:MAG: hypothetical protein Tsb005_15940 [Gammaproteobacteria bacterium]